MLPLPGGGELATPGRIARCTHRSGVIHEVGIAFSSPVRVRELIAPTPLPDFLALERVDPDSLRGFVLCITASDADARIIRHFLRITQLAVRTASTSDEAAKVLHEPFSAVIVDLDSPALADGRFAGALRAGGCHAPLVLITSNAAAAGPAIAASQADAVLTKPLSQDRLLRCIGECQLASAKRVQPVRAVP
jgi:CheY-like chemotaxis protein